MSWDIKEVKHMPPKENKGNKKQKKRKQISPLCNGNVDNSVNPRAQDTPSTHSVSKPKTTACAGKDKQVNVPQSTLSDEEVSKRLKFQTPSPVNYMYQPTMSYTPNASPGQFATPQGQFTPPYIQAPVSSEPPPWALSMIEDIKNVKT